MYGRFAASGGRPLPHWGGTAATGLRAIWGARTPAAEGCCAYDCPQMKKSLQSQTVQRFCR